MLPSLATAALLALAVVVAPPAPVDAINLPTASQTVPIVGVDDQFFIDALGRYRIFHGTNVVYKGPPYHPDISANAAPSGSFNQVDVDILASHGITTVRLGVLWAGVEPTRGNYDQGYLDYMKNIVQMLQDAGIYVLIDMHADGLSEKFCGQGVPLWAAQPESWWAPSWVPDKLKSGFPSPVDKPYNLDANGVPSDADCSKHYYSDTFLTYATGSAYQRLYKNHDGLTDSFVNFWKVVVQNFKDFKNIMGYEIINEPWAGNAIADPGLLVPGVADSLNLQPFYDQVAGGIRSVDPNAIIFFESVTWDNFVVGFSHPPGGSEHGGKSVLSFHHYQLPQLFNISVTYIERMLDMARLGCGGMLTEFEGGWGGGANVPAILDKLQKTDEHMFSFQWWEYTDYVQKTGTNDGIRDPNTGAIRPDMAKVFSRTYATAIPGKPTSMKFDDNTSQFTITFNHDGSANALEIRLNSDSHYPRGFNVQVDGGNMNVNAVGDFVYAAADPASANGLKGSAITVTVSSK